MNLKVRQLKSGNFGVFIDDVLVSSAKTEARANSAKQEINTAIEDSWTDGHGFGYDEGYSNGQEQSE